MSYFLDRLQFFKRRPDAFSGRHGVTRSESRDWEDGYRARWQYDKIVRSTHGVNCTGSCCWKIYVKNGLVTWETQQTDYPRTRPDLPNHEPRGCPRGASYSWYLYSANRLKYPLVRGVLLKSWREARLCIRFRPTLRPLMATIMIPARGIAGCNRDRRQRRERQHQRIEHRTPEQFTDSRALLLGAYIGAVLPETGFRFYDGQPLGAGAQLRVDVGRVHGRR